MTSRIPIRKTELAVGDPLPWPVYDVSNNLLMREGTVIQDRQQLDAIYGKGAYRNPLREIKSRRQPKSAPRESHSGAEAERSQLHKRNLQLKFSDMKLQLGERLQLQEVAGDKARHLVQVVGYMDKHSLIVTHPTRGGEPLVFLERQPFIVRALSGKHAFGFKTHLLKHYPSPYPHLHLASPREVEKRKIRSSERITCNIIASITADRDPEKQAHSAVISDLSTAGTKIAAREILGGKGATLTFIFRCQRDTPDDYLTLRGIVRDINLDARNHSILHGMEFIDLKNSDRLALENMIYRLRFEEI